MKLQDSIQQELFSKNRLQGYADTQEHEQNLYLIAQITHKIGILEIIIRNKIDSLLTSHNPHWLEATDFKDDLQKHTRDAIISRQSLGFWVKTADFHNIHAAIFHTGFLETLDFKKYYRKNKNRFNRTMNLRHYHKAKAILLLLRLIRNRAFHFENLYKFVGNGYPRLNIQIINKRNEGIYIAILPSKIIDFLNDVLMSFHIDLVYYAENLNGNGGRGSA
ncbi:hypothetical protein G4F72_001327 [Campylobacter upsaliensis]|uniref:hypothetical protein n=1 Tax=Helicobacter sp. TaxID=218 RepID=UPI001D978215|nr:hypothetical protein [Helicobacter sp.]EEA8818564.1 hypothetical protein [Campylobacter upsaliensis]EJW3040649.1 hypothetical protein [Campylobacter upsaliensis]MDY5951454.1 hypothetical protein [Helicobacter sp.]HEC1237894.1 hypothetical protein [Campylobacter upsaliensis]